MLCHTCHICMVSLLCGLSHVCVSRLTKCFVTHVTFVCFLSCVYSHVSVCPDRLNALSHMSHFCGFSLLLILPCTSFIHHLINLITRVSTDTDPVLYRLVANSESVQWDKKCYLTVKVKGAMVTTKVNESDRLAGELYKLTHSIQRPMVAAYVAMVGFSM